MRKLIPVTAAVALALAALPLTASATAGTGPAVTFPVQGNIGEVIVNPYDVAPLTAVIRNGGYVIEDATVRIVPKEGGIEIKYDVGKQQLLTHGGIPVLGMYPDYVNTVEVTYTRVFFGKKEQFTDTYKIYTAPMYAEVNGSAAKGSVMFDVNVVKADSDFADRLYLVDTVVMNMAKTGRAIWNNPQGGALEWASESRETLIDTKGEVRWYLLPSKFYDPESIYKSGSMMGVSQAPDGALTWGFGQRYVKYDLLGRQVFDRRLPIQYADFSHALHNGANGHQFLRVAGYDVRRADNKRVHTVRDIIAEVDKEGQVVDEFRLFDILDPYRDNVIKVLDQGAVCLNIDLSKSGQTLSAEEIAALDSSDVFGDVTGTGIGRNWAHVNSIDYDQRDDSIIISSRHQSCITKIGRDKQIKWILASPEGWKPGWAEKLLTPVDSNGTPLKCENSKCEGDFDYTWTQHSAFIIQEKSDGDILYITAFDNGDGRGMEQPAMASMKYSRAVVYKIDQKKMTVEQVWEYGKERGHDWYSPVTSLTKYMADKDSIMVFSSTVGLGERFDDGRPKPIAPWIEEFRWGETDPAVEINVIGAMGGRAIPLDLKKAFGH